MKRSWDFSPDGVVPADLAQKRLMYHHVPKKVEGDYQFCFGSYPNCKARDCEAIQMATRIAVLIVPKMRSFALDSK
jgi:hypothetical protein